MSNKNIRVLVDGSGFENEYVAVASFNDNKPICSDKDAAKCFEKALAKGYPNPVIIFIPDPDRYYCFYAA